MQTSRQLIWLGVIAQAWSVTACSSSSSSAASGSDGGGGSATDASQSDDAGATLPIMELNDASSASPPPSMVTCGTMMCTAAAGGMLPLAPCCLAGNGCGAMIDLSALGMGVPGATDGGGCLDPSAGNPDPSCPSQSIMGFNLAGCCSKTAACGVDLSMAGLGCNSLSVLGALAGGGGTMGPPQACTPGQPGMAAIDGSAPSEAGGAAQDAGSGQDAGTD